MPSKYGSVYFELRCASTIPHGLRAQLRAKFKTTVEKEWAKPKTLDKLATPGAANAVPNGPEAMKIYIESFVWGELAKDYMGGYIDDCTPIIAPGPDLYCITSTELHCYHYFAIQQEYKGKEFHTHFIEIPGACGELLLACVAPT